MRHAARDLERWRRAHEQSVAVVKYALLARTQRSCGNCPARRSCRGDERHGTGQDGAQVIDTVAAAHNECVASDDAWRFELPTTELRAPL